MLGDCVVRIETYNMNGLFFSVYTERQRMFLAADAHSFTTFIVISRMAGSLKYGMWQNMEEWMAIIVWKYVRCREVICIAWGIGKSSATFGGLADAGRSFAHC